MCLTGPLLRRPSPLVVAPVAAPVIPSFLSSLPIVTEAVHPRFRQIILAQYRGDGAGIIDIAVWMPERIVRAAGHPERIPYG
jgi:hypothetical protein